MFVRAELLSLRSPKCQTPPSFFLLFPGDRDGKYVCAMRNPKFPLCDGQLGNPLKLGLQVGKRISVFVRRLLFQQRSPKWRNLSVNFDLMSFPDLGQIAYGGGPSFQLSDSQAKPSRVERARRLDNSRRTNSAGQPSSWAGMRMAPGHFKQGSDICPFRCASLIPSQPTRHAPKLA